MDPCAVLHYHEISLKRGNRPLFLRHLARNLTRALADVGSTCASTNVYLTPRKGSARAIKSAAAAAAMRPGKRITSWASRYQKPSSAGRASRSARRTRKPGAR